MSETILVLRPDHDDTTFYLHEWSEKVIDIINQLGKKLIDLKQKRANRKNFEGIIKNKAPDILFLNGHGTENSLCGHGNEAVLDIENMHLLNSRVTYARSCRTARVLGYQAVKQENAKAFIGYKRDFTFPYDSRKTASPLKDDIRTPILESSNMAIISLVRGKTPKSAYEISQDTYKNWIIKLINSKEPEAPEIIKHLLWNKQNQVLFEN